MADRPILVLPKPTEVARAKKGGGASHIHLPSGSRQVARIDPRFSDLERVFASKAAELLQSPVGVEPEQVLVFETIGRIDDFFTALKGVEGLEWLGDMDLEDIPPDEDFFDLSKSGKQLPGRLYLVMSNQRGMEQLRSLWATYKSEPDAPQFEWGKAKWKHLFNQLRDIRPWGPQDRLLDTGLAKDWRQRMDAGEETAKVEVELWFRGQPEARDHAIAQVSELVTSVHGVILAQACIPEIAYHSLLTTLPITVVERILRLEDVALVRSEQVMFFRSVGQTAVSIDDQQEHISGMQPGQPQQSAELPPIVALLDGLPIENHALLANRLIVDDPDSWSDQYPADYRVHGTAMASLIIHGELDAHEQPLPRPVYVRPIMKAVIGWWRGPSEAIPEDVLPVDLVHRAVVRMFEGDGDTPPTAPTVRVINLSVGDLGRPFDFAMSPWARLLDYLSWKYRVLFVVSAGNHGGDIVLEQLKTGDFSSALAAPQDLEARVLAYIAGETRNRRLLSPAEAMNALTVGAVHRDRSSTSPPPALVDPYQSQVLPSPVSAHGLGFRRSMKPDIVFPGGRQLYRLKLASSQVAATLEATPAGPGQKVAAPSKVPGDLSAVRYSRGTSNAAALATRAAAHLYEVISDVRNEPNGGELREDLAAVLLKAMLTHGASWGEASEHISRHLPGADLVTIARMLGYGEAHPDRLSECTKYRATLIGAGELSDSQAHLYSVPLPPSLSGLVAWRRLTITLAWLSPGNPRHRGYRLADLWFNPYGVDNSDGSAASLLKVTRQLSEWQMQRRGTVQHEVFEGQSATSFVDGEALKVQVNCKSGAGTLTVQAPYALAVTLEVAPEQTIDVYQEIRERVQPKVQVLI